jgi:uncharacterized protein (DUF58 family)
MSVKNSLLNWLTPQDLSRISQLQLFARGVVEGVRGGIHRSRHLGASIEFKEHRPYVPGDDVGSIDWKLFGKTDRLYIRQYEDETNLRCTLLVDQSGSMKYRNARSGRPSKHEYAMRLAACLAYLFVSQKDAVGLATFDTQIRAYLEPRSQPNHLQLLMEALTESKPGGETDLGLVIEGLLQRSKRRGILFLISDCFGDIPQLCKSLALLRSNHQEVVVFQVMDDDEWDFPFQQRTLFRSLEVESLNQVVDPEAIRKSYLQKMEADQQALALGCRQPGIEPISTRTSRSYSELLSQYLGQQRGYG